MRSQVGHLPTALRWTDHCSQIGFAEMIEPRFTHLKVVPRDKEAWRLSVVLAALESLMKFDECAVLRAACRARYLDLTDGDHDAS